MAKKKQRIEKKVKIGNKRVSVYGYTAFEIQQKIENLQAAAERKVNPTFRDIADAWQEEHDKNIEYYTADCYKAPLKDVNAEFGDVRITEITPIDIQNFINAYSLKGYKRQTVKLRLSVIKQVYDYAILHGLIQTNPTATVTIPRTVKNGIRELPSADDIEKIKEVVRLGFELFPFFVLYTGLRKEEALAIRYEDIDFESDSITVNKVVIFTGGGKPTIRAHTKSAAGMRTAPLLTPLKRILEQSERRTGYVFSSKTDGSEPYAKGTFDYLFAKYRKQYGIKCGIHQLRHEYATFCYDAGLDTKEAQKLLGHSKESVTRDIYTHIRESRQQEAIRKLNAFVT